MEIGTIEKIRERRDEIREKIKSADFSKFSSNTYGSENEYTFKGIVGGLDSLLVDISTLTKAPNKFIAISTYTERNNIISYLQTINTYFETPNNYLSYFEELKVIVRNFNIRGATERQIEFETEINNLTRIKLELQEELCEVKKIKEEIKNNSESIEENIAASNEKLTEIEKELETINKKKEELKAETESLKEYNEELETAKEKADENLASIVQSMTESKSNEKLISSFASKVQERDKRLEELEALTNENSKKLISYESERQKILTESQTLIESAKKALNYKTAEGISASFQTQYENANNKYVFGSWLVGAVICLIVTIILGLWILNTIPNDVMIFIARISLLPLPIIGAIFCANQYTKQKNIIEDYAYKMVLAKSIVGFSEQLKKNGTESNEEYIHYIKTALEEIHKDPLRKRTTSSKESKIEPANLGQIGELLEKITKLIKPD
jgi:small basic protein